MTMSEKRDWIEISQLRGISGINRTMEPGRLWKWILRKRQFVLGRKLSSLELELSGEVFRLRGRLLDALTLLSKAEAWVETLERGDARALDQEMTEFIQAMRAVGYMPEKAERG
jgi:hypothetical protein